MESQTASQTERGLAKQVRIGGNRLPPPPELAGSPEVHVSAPAQALADFDHGPKGACPASGSLRSR